MRLDGFCGSNLPADKAGLQSLNKTIDIRRSPGVRFLPQPAVAQDLLGALWFYLALGQIQGKDRFLPSQSKRITVEFRQLQEIAIRRKRPTGNHGVNTISIHLTLRFFFDLNAPCWAVGF